MVNGGFKRKEGTQESEEENMAFKYSNQDLMRMTGTQRLRTFILKQQLKYIAHICRLPNDDIRKKMLFSQPKFYNNA